MTKSGKHVQLLYWSIFFFCQWKKAFHVYASGRWKSAFLKDKQWI